MFHISSRLRPHVTSKMVRSGGGRRLQWTQSGSGGGGKVLMAAAGTSSLVAGVVGYSAWSDDNRKGVEGTLPGSKYLLNAILGPMVESLPLKTLKPDVGLVKKRLEQEKKKEVEEAAPVVPAAPLKDEPTSDAPKSSVEGEIYAAAVTSSEEVAPVPNLEAHQEPAPSTTSSTTEIQSSSSAPSRVESDTSDLEIRMASGEMTEDVENAALSEALDELASIAQKEMTGALSAVEEAAEVIRQHAEKAYQAIDASQDKEALFETVAELSSKRAQVVNAAQDKIAAAQEAVEKLTEQITSGLSSSLTKGNKSLIIAEERLGDMKYALQRITAVVSEAERDGKVVSDFHELVDAGRKQFESEVRSLLPEVRLGETSDKLTPDELNLLIAHAHRKVLQLQKQVARLQSLEHEGLKAALVRQREEDSQLLQTKVETELEHQRQQQEMENKHKLVQLHEELEAELRTQLKRQAAAHSDHLSDVLYVQEKELETKWSDLLDDQLGAEKDKYLTSISKMKGQLDGLKNALSERADVDKAAHASREMWLACESLRSALRNAGDDAKSWEEQLKPLRDQVAAIKTAASEGNPYVGAVLTSMSEKAEQRGVYTEEALRERFIKIDRICKRVSMIGDNGGSLVRYLLSYIQSFLVLNAFEYLPGNEVRNEEVAVDSLSTYDILARARYCLDKDDLTQTVRYMNLLRGEPRNVAKSWLTEARLTLETRQAAEALLAHAAATAVKAL